MTIEATTIWAVILGLSVCTYALRASFLLGIDWIDGLPPSLESSMPYLLPAIMAAFVAPSLLMTDGSLAVTPHNERLLAGLVAALVAWFTESMTATVTVGMGTLWILLWL